MYSQQLEQGISWWFTELARCCGEDLEHRTMSVGILLVRHQRSHVEGFFGEAWPYISVLICWVCGLLSCIFQASLHAHICKHFIYFSKYFSSLSDRVTQFSFFMLFLFYCSTNSIWLEKIIGIFMSQGFISLEFLCYNFYVITIISFNFLSPNFCYNFYWIFLI